MASPPDSALRASVVAAIDDLELAARLVVEGLRTGGHRSPFHGYSTEFRQHRPYRAGDDLKYLDWKLYGRSDRLYTRQFRETTNLSVMLVLDSSASMAFPISGLSKFRYAAIIAAALAYLTSEQSNAIGLLTGPPASGGFLPARGGRAHLRALIARLDRLRPGQGFTLPQTIDTAARLLRRRGVIVVLSDGYDDDDATQREMRRAVQYGHDVSLLQVISAEERDLPFTGHVELEDLETGERRRTDASAIAAEYHRRFNAFVARTRAESVRAGIDYALLPTDAPPERALRDYLLRRGVRPGGFAAAGDRSR
jgi:uncharacterized protein (DUF58 family)